MRVNITSAIILTGLLMAGCADQWPTWNIAELEGLNDSQWGPVSEEAGRQYRPALAGRSAGIVVPTWWGSSFRPREGSVYVLKVTYKDTAAKPVILSAHAGVQRYWRASEVHRFGGHGDGTWKTADVPISWDLICRKNAPGNMTELFITADKDLPVQSIVVTPPGPGAAHRYFSETRAWVARAQANKRKGAYLGAKQKPVIPALMRGKMLIPYARTYMSALMPNSAPQKGEAGAALKLRMARNEYEPAAFGVYATGRDLKGVTFAVSELSGPGGTLACELDLRTAEYAAVIRSTTGGRTTYRMFPQRLWPMYPVTIKKGRSHWFWITVKTLGKASKPGKYTGKVEIGTSTDRVDTRNSRGDTINRPRYRAALPIEVEVLPVHLLTMQEAKLDLGSCATGLVTLQELKTLAEHNHTGMHLWFGGVQPQMKIRKGKLIQDFYYLDPWMTHAAKRLKMTHMFWFMGGNPYGFPDTMNLERDLYRAQEGDRQALRREFLDKAKANPDEVIPEVRDFYVEWVRQTARHARRKGWPMLVMHPFDEPAKWVQRSKSVNRFHPILGTGPWIKPHFKDCCALIRKGAKGYDNVLVGGDIHHAEPGIVFVEDIDVFCTNAIHEDLKLGDKVRAAGTQFWQYSGTGDSTPAHYARFTFGWYFAAFDSRGSLIWAYNAVDRFDTSGRKGWGFGWYTPFGTVVAPFMAGVREGFDDRRWIETYKKLVVARDPAAQKLLDKIGQAAIARRTKRGRDTVSDFYAEMKRYQDMDVWRGRVIDAILKKARRR